MSALAVLPKIRTLRGRLGFFYSCVLALSLTAFAGTLYTIISHIEDAEADPSGEEARELELVRHRFLWALGIAVPVGLVIAIGGGTWVTRRAFVSLNEVVRTAAVLGPDNIHARIPSFAGAGQEVEQVAAALNGMLDRLERAVLGLRRFTANAAHELRTPLTILLGNLELSLRRPHEVEAARTTMEDTFEELERMTQLVEALLTLARSDSHELPISAVTLDAVELVNQIVGLYETVASERGIALCLHGAAALPLHTDPLWLNRVVVNLIDNACKFTPAGGQVDVYLQPAPRGVQIAVQDSGPGITDGERPRIFERFFRGAGTSGTYPGFGLGLSLAKELTQALGGTLGAAARSDGQPGTRFTLQIPDRPPA